MRLSVYVLVVLIALSTAASADLKIKTRTTVMGHSTESTVYIKGSRERNETSYGGHGGSVTIMQCDQKRMITLNGTQCSVMSMGGGDASCPATPNMRAMGEVGDGEGAAPRKGGVISINRTSTDTGETKEIFGYKARHIRSSMMMEPSADACNQSHLKMETDGWYADIPGFSCADESYRGMSCMGGKRGCSDRIVLKDNGKATLGYPLQQTTTIVTEHGTFTTQTEVIEITNATLDAPLFDMPPGCKAADMSGMAGASPTPSTASAPASAAPATPPAPAKSTAAPAVAVPPKAAGAVRIGVVNIKDASGQSLPTDSLQLNLMSEFARNQLDAVALTADSPLADVETEARAKQCDYFVFTTPTQVKDPNSGGLPAASVPKGVTLDPSKYQALTNVTLYKVGKPTPELKDAPMAADAGQFAVDAVTATFVLESNKIAQQVADDAHPKAGPKTSKPTTRSSPGTKTK